MQVILGNICGNCEESIQQGIFDQLNLPFVGLIIILLIYTFIKITKNKQDVSPHDQDWPMQGERDMLMQPVYNNNENRRIPFSELSFKQSSGMLLVFVTGILVLLMAFAI